MLTMITLLMDMLIIQAREPWAISKTHMNGLHVPFIQELTILKCLVRPRYYDNYIST